jgi:SWI/SNF-related matrix-associated actin-dependent regulator of chromatin subfamily A-like protein 1
MPRYPCPNASVAAKLVCLAVDPTQPEPEPVSGQVWLLADNPREPELVFDFSFNEELNEAVKELPRRWFDWRRKHWRVPAHARVAKQVEDLLARFPDLVPSPDVLSWLSDSDRWRAVCTVVAREGRGHFLVRTLQGERPGELDRGTDAGDGRTLFPFGAENATLLRHLDGVRLDDLAAACARLLELGERPPAAEMTLQMDEDGEPAFTVFHTWDRAPVVAFRELSEAHPVHRPGRFFLRDAPWGVAVPADAALAPQLTEYLEAHPEVHVEEPARELLEELTDEFERAAETVALSYADDAELDGLELGGVLHPFQRAGVRYALARRRTFIAYEQGLGKTVQALATIEWDDAFPTVVVCPASMKLVWEREAQHWLPNRTVAVLGGRTDEVWTEETAAADIVVLNYDILDWHSDRLAQLEPRALILDESHYVKNARAARTKAALELANRLPDGALRLALTGTPILNRAEELVSQLRVIGRLKDFGSGARLTRRFKAAGSDDRLHWNLRAHCYVRRTKAQVLPQLPAKRHDTVPVLLSNEHEYRLAERDVIAWLQTLPLDLRAIDAKVAAALRAEQLVKLNNLRQLAARGKLPTALAWVADFLESGEPLVVFAEHIATQKAVLERFPEALHILGSDTAQARQRAVDSFQDEEGPQLIVCSLKAASQGITLTRASNVAFIELDWTPARHDQAEDRLHRIGQESAVTAWYLLAPDTIDETMAELLERKRSLIDAVTDGEVRDEERLVDAVVRELRGRPFRHLRVVA